MSKRDKRAADRRPMHPEVRQSRFRLLLAGAERVIAGAALIRGPAEARASCPPRSPADIGPALVRPVR